VTIRITSTSQGLSVPGGAWRWDPHVKVMLCRPLRDEEAAAGKTMLQSASEMTLRLRDLNNFLQFSRVFSSTGNCHGHLCLWMAAR
jgi:hypothetical protein